jgi:hypothetical protein
MRTELERAFEQLRGLSDGHEPRVHDANQTACLRPFDHQAEPVQLGAAADREPWIGPVAGVQQLDERERVRAPEPAGLGERLALADPLHETSQPPRRRRVASRRREVVESHHRGR